MELTLKRFVPLGEEYPVVGDDLLDPDTWDSLRLETGDSAFSVPADRESWLARCQKNRGYAERARTISTVLREAGAERVISIGAGVAVLEYHLTEQSSDLDLVVSDYSPGTVERLDDITNEFEAVVEFDLLEDSPEPWVGRWFLIHRVDTDLSDAEWRSVFDRLHRHGVEQIIFVPAGVLTPRVLVRTLFGTLRARLPGADYTLAGYVRTPDRIEALWRGRYASRSVNRAGGAPVYLLDRRHESS